MSKNNQPIFEWNEESGIAKCILTSDNNTFIGTAKCATQDEDMKSEKTGCTIALFRAEINYFYHIKNNIYKPELNALKQLYYSINKSKKFNSNSYETKMLIRQIKIKETDLFYINDIINNKKQELKDYINSKELTFKKLRYLKNKRENPDNFN